MSSNEFITSFSIRFNFFKTRNIGIIACASDPKSRVVFIFVGRIQLSSRNECPFKPSTEYEFIESLQLNSYSIAKNLNIVWMPIYSVKVKSTIIFKIWFCPSCGCALKICRICICLVLVRLHKRCGKHILLSFSISINIENINFLPRIS